jgi:HEAT repeat protein
VRSSSKEAIFSLSLAAFLFSTAFSGAQLSEEAVVKRVQAHLIIGDLDSAVAEAQAAVQQNGDSKLIAQALIRAYAKKGEAKALQRAWEDFLEKYPEERGNRELLEALAWSSIENGAASSSPMLRITAILGGFFSQDAKGVAILRRGLSDENWFLRAAAIQLAAELHDACLQEEILRLFRSDKVWRVRLEAIKAIGQLRQAAAREELLRLIANEQAHAEEQAAAIQAIVLISEGISPEHLSRLVESKRMGMRLLACEFVAHFAQKDEATLLVPLLVPLVSDPHVKVRAKLYQTLGRLRLTKLAGQPVVDIAAQGVRDPHPYAAISAAWLLSMHAPQQAEAAFDKWLNHSAPHIRRLAAAAVAASGKYGSQLALRHFSQHEDQYVKMNLALGLIGQRICTEAAADCLYHGLSAKNERWVWRENQFFRVLEPARQGDAVADDPQAEDQLTRLELLQLLAMLHYPRAQEALRHFLQERSWEISGLATALLLTEGDEAAIELVKELLNDQDATVRIRAALILALWGKEESVLQFLQAHYTSADRELKAHILEGIGRVGSASSLAFLAERLLQEPYPSLRMTAAAALLECLYH